MSEARETVLPTVDPAMLGHFYMPGITSHYQSQQQEQATDQSAPADDFQFVSGSRPLDPLATKGALPRYAKLASQLFVVVRLTNHSIAQEQEQCSGIKCDFPGCSSKRTFKRKYELQRHRKKHTPRETFECPAINCKYRGPKAFYRSDKLKAHVLAGHDPETLFACPVAGCFSARTPLSRAMLAVHLRNHDRWSCEPYLGYFTALADCDQFRTCPVGKCLKKLSPYSLQEHVLQHTEAERSAHHIKIAAAGLDPLTGCVICPVISCRIRLPDLPAFQDHLIDHIALDADHFRAWKAKTIHSYEDIHQRPWQRWYFHERFVSEVCGYSVCTPCGEHRVTHPFDLLKDSKDLHVYREEILQLYPGIGWHPIFDDIMPVVHRRNFRVP